MAYLGWVGGPQSLDHSQSQQADRLWAREDQVAHQQAQRAQLRLVGPQGRSHRQQPLSRRHWVTRQATQSGKSHGELAVPGAEQMHRRLTGLKTENRMTR